LTQEHEPVVDRKVGDMSGDSPDIAHEATGHAPMGDLDAQRFDNSGKPRQSVESVLETVDDQPGD
jgi:hypothetical protein